MDFEQINSNTILLNDFYRVSIDYMQQLTQVELREDEEEIRFFDDTTKNKIDFIKSDYYIKNSCIKSCFNNIFVEAELVKKKDLSEFSYNEILDILRLFGEKKIIKTERMYKIYAYTISAYTKWAYNENKRNDIVLTEDITQKISTKDIIKKDVVRDMVLTKNQMIKISKMVSDKIEIGILGFLEGLKTIDVLSLRIDDFRGSNHEILVNDRVVKLSDNLFEKCKSYSLVQEEEKGMRRGFKMRELLDTGYVLRPVKSKRAAYDKLNIMTYAATFRRDMEECGFEEYEQRNFRQSAILNDVVDGMCIEDINEKYGLKYKNIPEIIKDKQLYNVLVEKRRAEESL